MIVYTVGFTQKSAEEFFAVLKNENIDLLIDIRLNNSSQLAGFSKGNDLKYFLKEICDIDYVHDLLLAPTKFILDGYKKKEIDWDTYEKQYRSLLIKRNATEIFFDKYIHFGKICLLCSEPKPDLCHRRLLAETIKGTNPSIAIVHL